MDTGLLDELDVFLGLPDYVAVSALGILGTWARIGVTYVAADVLEIEGWDGVVPKYFFANLLGSFVLGWLHGYVNEERFPVLFVGVGTGFCGCFTTFSGWAVEESQLLLSSKPPTGYGQTAAITTMVVVIACSASSYVAGNDTAKALPRLKPDAKCYWNSEDRRGAFLVYGSMLLALYAAMAVLLAVNGPEPENSSRSAEYWFAGLVSPPGAVLRLWLGRRLNHLRAGVFPFGTFAANVLGTAILAGLIGFEVEGSGPWRVLAVTSIETGFTGSLTTVSTFVAETVLLRRNQSPARSFVYCVGTMFATQVVAGILIAPKGH